MIKFEHTVTPSPEQMEFIIEGMRNPMDSWKKSDSFICKATDATCPESCPHHVIDENGFIVNGNCPIFDMNDHYIVGVNDKGLMERLKNGGIEHRKFMRMMPVMVRITAPLYWWKEFDTYKIGTVRNSCSTMHTLHNKGVTLDSFSHEWVFACRDDIHTRITGFSDDHRISTLNINLVDLYQHYLRAIEHLRGCFNETHDKKYWYAMIQMLPDGFMMTANVSMNYEVIFNQMHQRAHHKQEEWSGQDGYLAWAKTLPYQFLFDEKKEE